MLEKPNIQDKQITQCLQAAYGLTISDIVFLPLGADVNAAVYRAVGVDQTLYFVKLRRGGFDPTSVLLPRYLSGLGIAQIIAPLKSQSGQLWANFADFTLTAYPFVEGQNGYRVALSEQQWIEFGSALKRIHSAAIPETLSIQQESYSAQRREQVREFLRLIQNQNFDDPVATKLAVFLQEKNLEVLALVQRAEQLAQALQARPLELVICHSDIHAGNVLIGDGGFYIVDWDNPILAPKERDLMFIGGGQGFIADSAQQEEPLFYRGYGPTQINQAALAYYRYERIVQDIAAFCQELLLSSTGGADREQSLGYLMSNFLPRGTLEVAYNADKS